ncbi:unnamed protein product [Spirodela intermedia]|uniref:Glucosamine 6-phosphate N-acetyltransferase n=1 Tax=Spirodela intermedia TaxID=51605 RepID=A0A7I8IUM5_SPIIN|nr:unnamed protein product [Spirodela intermedia]CAA6661587.1 unnamed protein product [Spirodela intermedia]
MAKMGEEQHEADSLLPIRRLQASDKSKGFEFLSRFAELASHGDDHAIVVAEDEQTGRIIATGSVFVEKKFLRGCGKVGHIEDVVVDASARGRRLGQRVVRHLVGHARAAGCYKVILDCSAENRGFYEKCGFQEKNVQMAVYFHE